MKTKTIIITFSVFTTIFFLLNSLLIDLNEPITRLLIKSIISGFVFVIVIYFFDKYRFRKKQK